MLRKLITAGVGFIREMEVRDVGLLKLCLIAFGALLGLSVPARDRKPSALLAAVVFFGAFATLMGKFLASVTRVKEE